MEYQYPWKPNNFREFRSKALAGYVYLDVRPDQHTDIGNAGLSPSGLLDYNEKLLYKMTISESVFRKVHKDIGVDFYLYAEPKRSRIRFPFLVELKAWIKSKMKK